MDAVRTLTTAGYSLGEVTAISFYSPRVSAMRNALAAAGFPLVAVGTVDAVQGQESEVVLLSSVQTFEPRVLVSERHTMP